MKKLFTLLLALVLAFTILPVQSISAADNTVSQATVKNITIPLPGQYLADYKDTTTSTEEGKYYVVTKDCYWTDAGGVKVSNSVGFYKDQVYFYTIALKVADGYIFSKDTALAIKGQTVNPAVETVIGNGGHEITFKNAYKIICGEVPKIASVILSKDNYYYDGKVKKPSVKSVLDADGNGVSSSYYKVSYSDGSAKKVGVYTVSVTAKSPATGSASASYKINPSAPKSVKVSSPKKGNIKVSWSKPSSGKPDQYDILIYKDSACKQIYKSAKTKGTSKTISGLKSGTKYYVRVDCCVEADVTLVSKGSAKKAVKVK